jgi:hypothetical protein
VAWLLSDAHVTSRFLNPPQRVDDRAALRAEYRQTLLASHRATSLHQRAALQASAARLRRSLTAAGDFDGAVIALLVEGDQEHEYGDGDSAPLHCTICYLGDAAQLTPQQSDAVVVAAKHIGERFAPFDADVQADSEFGDTPVRLVEHPDIESIHTQVLANPEVGTLAADNGTHPHFIPHVSGLDDRDSVRFDRIAAMLGGTTIIIPLTGGTQTPDTDVDADAEDLQTAGV